MSGHPTREEDFDLYALGALEGDEKHAIESHAASCSECAHKLAEARGRIALLAFAAPPFELSPGVKECLMRQLHSAAEGRAYEPARVEPESTRGIFGRWSAAVLAPAAAALALASVFLWLQNARLEKQIAEQRLVLDDQKQLAEQARDLLALMQSGRTVSITLKPMPGMPQGDVKVMYNSDKGKLVYEGWISPPPDDKSYQLWLVPMDGSPISAGVFNPETGDTNMWLTSVPQGVTAKAFAITMEPAGGMPHPTGPMVLVGPAS
jgi:anti-sigma-K factor RskA